MKNEKEFVGTLRGFDDYVNMVLDDVVEYESAWPDGSSVCRARYTTRVVVAVVLATPWLRAPPLIAGCGGRRARGLALTVVRTHDARPSQRRRRAGEQLGWSRCC